MPGGMVPLSLITNANPGYLRQDLGDLTALTKSVKKDGLHAPILCDSSYLILDGARRVEALKTLRATEVWCLATDTWETVRDQFLQAAKRHESEPFLPKSYVDLAALAPRLCEIKRVATAKEGIRNRGGPRKPPSVYRFTGVSGLYMDAFGVSEPLAKATMRAGNKIAEYRFLGERVIVNRIVEALREAERQGLVSRTDNLVDHAVDPSVRLLGGPRTGPKPLIEPLHGQTFKAQIGTVQRVLDVMEATSKAIPAVLDPRHTNEDIVRWRKQIVTINTAMRRLSLSFRAIETERENGNTEAAE